MYLPTTDVVVKLDIGMRDAAHAYLCVFNAGEWRPIQWGDLRDRTVTFPAMGRNIAYLPATYGRKGVEPAGPPFIVTAEGDIRYLPPSPRGRGAVSLAATCRGAAGYRLASGKTYELSVYDRGWRSLGRRTAAGQPLEFASVPSGGLYWLVEDGSRREERIFTIENGTQVWW
jgi:hypothetical protein